MTPSGFLTATAVLGLIFVTLHVGRTQPSSHGFSTLQQDIQALKEGQDENDWK